MAGRDMLSLRREGRSVLPCPSLLEDRTTWTPHEPKHHHRPAPIVPFLVVATDLDIEGVLGALPGPQRPDHAEAESSKQMAEEAPPLAEPAAGLRAR